MFEVKKGKMLVAAFNRFSTSVFQSILTNAYSSCAHLCDYSIINAASDKPSGFN